MSTRCRLSTLKFALALAIALSLLWFAPCLSPAGTRCTVASAEPIHAEADFYYFSLLDLTATGTSSAWLRLQSGATVAAVIVLNWSGDADVLVDESSGVGLALASNGTMETVTASVRALMLIQSFAGTTVTFAVEQSSGGDVTACIANGNGPQENCVATIHTASSTTFTVNSADLVIGGPVQADLDDLRATRGRADPVPPGPQFPEGVVRTRVEVHSTSTWASVTLVQGAKILAVYLVSVNGSGATTSGHILYQSGPNARTTANPEQTAVVDAVFSNVSITGTVEWQIEQGNGGTTRVAVFNYNGDQPVLVGEIEVSNTTPRILEVAGELLLASGPVSLDEARRDVPRLTWATYHADYQRLADWDSEIYVDRPASRYISSDPDAIARHVAQAKAAFLDGFVLANWSPGNGADSVLPLLLTEAERQGFYVSVSLAGQSNASGQVNIAGVTSDLRYLLDNYGGHPAYYRLGGLPVVWVSAADKVSPALWDYIFEQLWTEGRGALYIADSTNPDILTAFDGLMQEAVYLYHTLPSANQRWMVGVRANSAVAPRRPARLWVATLSPGSDQRRIGYPGQYRPRLNGATYTLCYEAALASAADWLVINSWNDFRSNTHIEPSENYARQYLDITTGMIARWGRPYRLYFPIMAWRRS
ncbi:MAG: hypothetical protein H5T64_08840 [Chloroflexi bacterium]|nr:hypothetical protein [Chloroflexota bacterium]